MPDAKQQRAPEEPAVQPDARVEFMDLASHELRSPLTALSGTAQMLQRRLRQDPDRAADLADVNRMLYQIERLSNQLDVLLAATHLAEHRFELTPVECDAVAGLRRVTELFGNGNGKREIRFECAEERIVGEWDRKRIEELLTILLVNALKFSRQGEIVVRVAEVDSRMHVEVADRGCGVAPKDRHRIFERYQTGDTQSKASSGLGLFVARAIVRGHGGKIGLRANPGGGSVFWFDLPAILPARAETSGKRAATNEPAVITGGPAPFAVNSTLPANE
ncbi:MAG TPA: HAMP domain-containing sensor histidine kinase [Ktedonobacterales bacterium]|nr:HAMP domain-containing sensor histidine kinase [Ktedonobacterales bacterium]